MQILQEHGVGQIVDSYKQMAPQNLNKCSVFSVQCKLYFRNHFYSIYYNTFFSYLISLLLNGSRSCSQSTRNCIMIYLIASEHCTLISLVNLRMTFNFYPISRNEIWYFTNGGKLLMLCVVGGKVCTFQSVYSWAQKLKASFRLHNLFVPPFNLNIFRMTASHK